MSWYSIKLDPADKIMSWLIRMRDKKCLVCGKQGQMNDKGEPILGLQCSHYLHRRKESTRFDFENCIALCPGCHHKFEGARTKNLDGDYDIWMRDWLGEKRFNLLLFRGSIPTKKDRKMSLLVLKQIKKGLK